MSLFSFEDGSSSNGVRTLRSASVRAEPRSTGPRAPSHVHRTEFEFFASLRSVQDQRPPDVVDLLTYIEFSASLRSA